MEFVRRYLLLGFLKEYVKRRVEEFVLYVVDKRMSTQEGITEKDSDFITRYVNPDGTVSKVRISNKAVLIHPENIWMGNYVFIGHHTKLDGTGGLVIEDGCQINGSFNTHGTGMGLGMSSELDENGKKIPWENRPGYVKAPIRIKKYAGIADGAVVDPGVTIGEGSWVDPNSIVRAPIPDFSWVKNMGNKTVEGEVIKLKTLFIKRKQKRFSSFNGNRKEDSR